MRSHAGGRPRKYKKEVMDRRVGRIKSRNSRGAGLFYIKVEERDGRATIAWTKRDSWRDWASLTSAEGSMSEGCYLLRTNITEWSAEEFTPTNRNFPDTRPFTQMGKRTPTIHCAEFFNRLGAMASLRATNRGGSGVSN